MKKIALAAIIGLFSASAFAAQGDILARVRVINVDPDNSVNNVLQAADVNAKSAWAPELDFTYMITNNIGAELILGTTRHKVESKLGSLGKVSVLPPTVTLQWHFAPDATVRPYAGVGINYTRFYSNGLKLPNNGGDINIKKNSWGPALQVGTDVTLNKDWFLNFDLKKIWIKTDVNAGGSELGTLKLDPWVFGVGIGTKF